MGANNPYPTVDDELLSEFIDGRLDSAAERRLRDQISADSALAARVATLVAQDARLRRLGEEVLAEPVPPRLRQVLAVEPPAVDRGPVLTRTGWSWRGWGGLLWAGSIAASLLIGATIGATMTGLDRASYLLEPFIKQAVLSHELLSTGQDLNRLQRGLKAEMLASVQTPFLTPVRLPDMLGAGFQPVMISSVQDPAGVGVQIAYLDPDQRLTSLFVRQHSDEDDVPVHYVERDGRSILYWLDGPLVYALVGEGNRAALSEMARGIYAAPARGGDWQPVSEIAPPRLAVE